MLEALFSRSFFRDRRALFYMIVFTLGVVANVLYILLGLSSRNYPVPVRYSEYQVGGFDRGQWSSLYVLAIFSAVVYVVNLLLAMKLHGLKPELSRLVLLLSIVVVIFNILVSRALLRQLL